MPHTVIIAAPITTQLEQYLQAQGATLSNGYDNTQVLAQAVGIVTSTKVNITAQWLQQAPQLQWIVRLGSGIEIIDQQAVQARGIQFFSTPAGLCNAVAEHTLALMIMLQKNILRSNLQVANMQWLREPNRGNELSHGTIGLIGYGHTGSSVAQKLHSNGSHIVAYDKYRNVSAPAHAVDLATLYQQATLVSYHVPLTTETTHYYNHQHFAQPHYLINTSRGPVASTAAILEGFKSGHLLGAGLDVLDFEQHAPFAPEHQALLQELLQYNCIITPHIAGYSHQATQLMCQLAQKELMNHVYQQS